MSAQSLTTRQSTPHQTSSQAEPPTRYNTRSLSTTVKKTKIELISESQSTIKNKETAIKWLAKSTFIIPGELITTATLSMALLYIANGKHDLCEMINETRAVALCLEDVHPNNHTNDDTRTNTEDFEEKMEEVAHRYLDVLSEGMDKAKEHHQQIINNAIEEVRANTIINLDSAPFAQKVDNLANTLLTMTDTLQDFMAQTNVAVNSLKEAPQKQHIYQLLQHQHLQSLHMQQSPSAMPTLIMWK